MNCLETREINNSVVWSFVTVFWNVSQEFCGDGSGALVIQDATMEELLILAWRH
jgi:hypothetical protein